MKPDHLPGAVAVHHAGLRFPPNQPRRAVDSYWRAHPLRADRLARALAALSGAPEGWTWRTGAGAKGLRFPPAPYREEAHTRGPGFCCICGQPVYRFGWHEDLWNSGEPNRRARWHACCVAAWKVWLAPHQHRRVVGGLQRRRCAQGGGRLLRGWEVDHRLPLHRVWREHRDIAWPKLLRFWGFPNLQALNRTAHAAKTSAEATARTERAYPSARVESPDCRFSGRGMPTVLNPAST